MVFPEIGTLAGLAVPTGDQLAPGPTVGLDCSVPPVGVHEIEMLPPDMDALSVAWLVEGGAGINELL